MDLTRPPAPIGTAVIRDIETGKRSVEMKVILDTGSDVALLPKAVINRMELNLPAAESVYLEGFDGTSREYRSIRTQLVFLGKRISGIYFLVDDPIGILGRDVLNHFALLFHGPALTWERMDTGEELGELS